MRKKMIRAAILTAAMMSIAMTSLAADKIEGYSDPNVITADAPFIQTAPEKVNAYAAISMTEDEARELELILAMEAQTEPFDGQRAVVEVIFNRVLSPEWPDTVHKVLSQRGQFSTWKYINDPYNIPNEIQCDAIAEVLNGAEPVLPDMEYVYFSTGRHSYATDYIKIEHHWFGKDKK